jgi:hypothetical protein
MTTRTVRKAAFVFTKEAEGPGETETVQLAVVIPRRVGLWFRHYALDHGLSMAELIRRILGDFMAAHGNPPNDGPIGAAEKPGSDVGDAVTPRSSNS